MNITFPTVNCDSKKNKIRKIEAEFTRTNKKQQAETGDKFSY